MPRFILAVTNDLVSDQRVDRMCGSLCEAGHEVLLVGRRFGDSVPLAGRAYRTERMRLLFHRSAFFYLEYNIRIFLKLCFKSFDVVWSNDTDTLLGCACAARLRRKKLVFDAHELFPEVPELVGRKRVQRVWGWVERRFMPRADACITVCQSIADEYARRCGVNMAVVRNFPLRKSKACRNPEPGRLLYQGAVNVGRGVRELIDVTGLLPDCRLTVVGTGDMLAELKAYAVTLPWHERIEFLGRIEPKSLHEITSRAELGFCLLEDKGLSYRYALPNRIGDLAQAQVPVLATDFVEMRKVLEAYGTGCLFEPCPSVHEGPEYDAYLQRLADAVRSALASWRNMPEGDCRALFERAGDELCWEREQHAMLRVVSKLFR